MAKEAKDVRVTPMAWMLFAMALGFLLLAYQKGNWPLGLFAFILWMIVLLAFAMPRLFLHALTGSRSTQQTAQRDEDVDFLLRVKSTGVSKSRFVVLEDQNSAAYPEERNPETFAESIVAGTPTDLSYRRKMYCRGVYELGPCIAKCSFPFGLVEVVRKLPETNAKMVVLPRVWPISRFLYSGTNPYRRDARRDKRGVDDEFVGVREYAAGDERRHVHWRSSAKLGRLVVREYQTYATGQLFAVIDFSRAAHCGSGFRSTFEYMVEIAASVAAAAQQTRQQIQFFGWRGAPWHCKVAGLGALNAFLQELARVNPDGNMPLRSVLQRLAHQIRPQDRLLVLHTSHSGVADLGGLVGLAGAGVTVERIEMLSQTFDGSIQAKSAPAYPGIRVRTIRGDLDLAPQLVHP